MDSCGLFIVNSDMDLCFSATFEIFYKLFDVKVKELSSFVFDIYNIWKPWEKDAFDYYLRNNLKQKAWFFELNESIAVVVSDLFEKEKLHGQASCFLPSQNAYTDLNSYVVYFYIKIDEFFVSVLSDKYDNSFLKINIQDGKTKFDCNNLINIKKVLGVSTTVFETISKENNINDIVKYISEISKFPFYISFDLVNKHPRKYKAIQINSMD